MRVLHVLHSMGFGGAEVLVHDFVRATRTEASHSVICLDTVGALGDSLRAEGVRVELIGRPAGLRPDVALRLRKVLVELAPDVVFAHQYTPFSYTAMALPTLRPRPGLVFVEHGRHYPDVRRPKRVLANRTVFLRYTDRVLAVCGYIKRLLVANEGIAASRITVVYNGVDPSRFDPDALSSVTDQDTPMAASTVAPTAEGLRAELGLLPSHQVVTCVARFHPVKDHPTLVRGFAHAARVLPDARLLLVGGGDQAPIETLAAELGIREKVIFAGVRRDIPAVYSASDLFAMASLSEGTSVTLLEAMLSRLAVVVTDVGGNPEIVERDRTGALVERSDHLALGAQMKALLSDPERRAAMGERGRARVLAKFTQAQMHAGWLAAARDCQRG